MEKITKSFVFSEKGVIDKIDLFLSEAGWINSDIIKSSASKVSEYRIYVTSYTNLHKYKLRNFALNEMEADFEVDSGQLKRMVFKDTSVHKTIVFDEKGAVITIVRGVDPVSSKTETITKTLKEPIIGISVNDKEMKAPFDLQEVYQAFTGLNLKYLTEEEIEEEKSKTNLWAELAKKLEEEGRL